MNITADSILEDCPARPITHGPRQHYFGYYDKPQFDASGRFALGLACDILDRSQTSEDVAEIGMVDMKNGDAWHAVDHVHAWNWQFGCLAQWLPEARGFIHADCRDGRFVSVIRDSDGRETGILSAPAFAVHPNGRYALTVDFARLSRLRPETGFRGVTDRTAHDPAPEQTGVDLLDLHTNKLQTLISLRKLAACNPVPSMAEGEHYVTHPLWNQSGDRFLFWHRWYASRLLGSRLYTMARDGSDLYCLHDAGNSHTTWVGSRHVLAWASCPPKGQGYWLLKDGANHAELIGADCLTDNGHFTFSPDGEWLLTDRSPDTQGERAILLYHWKSGRCVKVGAFATLPGLSFECRCDLHPRWHPDGRHVCFDSVHDGKGRQMYLLDTTHTMKIIASLCHES